MLVILPLQKKKNVSSNINNRENFDVEHRSLTKKLRFKRQPLLFNKYKHNMDLEKFIKETLVSIKKGLHSANEELVESGKTLSKDASATFLIGVDGCEKISFDIAVTVGGKTKKKGEGGIKVVSVGLGGGFDKTEKQQHLSRIKFNIHSRGTG